MLVGATGEEKQNKKRMEKRETLMNREWEEQQVEGTRTIGVKTFSWGRTREKKYL